MRIFLLPLLLCPACGGPVESTNACERYVQVLDRCLDEASPDTGWPGFPLQSDLDCPTGDELLPAEAAAFYDCAAAAYRQGDCATPEGAAAFAERVEACGG
ncbi:MAG: hypothetical protein ABIO70_00740 [Pseudomonadota bacterium]